MDSQVQDPLELWKRAQGGEAGAQDALFEIVDATLRRELRARRAPAQELDQLAQRGAESVLKFLHSGGEVRSNLSAFLKARAWGVLSDHRRALRTAARARAVEDVPEPMTQEPEPDARIRRAELVLAFRACVSRLDEKLGETFRMRYERGLETKAIAELEQIQHDTVHVRLFRARTQVRDCLSARGFDEGDLP